MKSNNSTSWRKLACLVIARQSKAAWCGTYERENTMTQTEFQMLCGEYLIEPNMALENENICEALRQRDAEQVKHILETEF